VIAKLLIPRGRPLFKELPLELLSLSNLLAFVKNGLVTLDEDGAHGMLLVYDGEITAAIWLKPNSNVPLTGTQAIQAWNGASAKSPITAEALEPNVVRVLPMLWSDIPFTPRIKVGHLVDLGAFVQDQVSKEHRDGMVAVSVEAGEHYGASLYHRGQHLLSYTDEGEVDSDQQMIERFKSNLDAYVGVQVAELSRAWLPLEPPSSWSSTATTTGPETTPPPLTPPLPEPGLIPEASLAPEPEPESGATSPTPFDPFPAVIRPSVEVDPFNPPVPETPSEPAPNLTPIRLDEVADISEEPRSTPPPPAPFPFPIDDLDESLVEERKPGTPTLRPHMPGLLDFNDIRDEARSRASIQKKEEETQDILETPLRLLMVKIRSLVHKQMPEFAATQILRDLYEMADRGATLEDAIQETSSRPIKGVTQAQLDNLVASWTDSYVTGH
jgi:hypothetical protein